MRSSKSRSRSKSNRNNNNRSVGNVVNRVFDSSGPEGKVRGTPQQIIEKYNQLTRDAQLSNDRVAAENFQQHAEHYLRLLADAMREQQERQQQHQERQQQNNQQGGGQQGGNQQGRNDGQGGGQPRNDGTRNDGPRNDGQGDGQQKSQQNDGSQQQPQPQQTEARKPKPQPKPVSSSDVIETSEGEESPLVDTPENAPKPRRSRRKPAPVVEAKVETTEQPGTAPGVAPDAAE